MLLGTPQLECARESSLSLYRRFLNSKHLTRLASTTLVNLIQRGVYRGSDYSLHVQKYGSYRLQKFKNCLTTVYSFTFLSSTVYKQKIDSILQSTGSKIKPIDKITVMGGNVPVASIFNHFNLISSAISGTFPAVLQHSREQHSDLTVMLSITVYRISINTALYTVYRSTSISKQY